jgi:hypothetical protein
MHIRLVLLTCIEYASMHSHTNYNYKQLTQQKSNCGLIDRLEQFEQPGPTDLFSITIRFDIIPIGSLSLSLSVCSSIQLFLLLAQIDSVRSAQG